MRKRMTLLPKGRKVHLLEAGLRIRLLPPAALRYELWSFSFRCGRILLEHRYAGGLVYDDAVDLYRSYKGGNHALVRAFSDFQQIVKFSYDE